jgi:hypothetical protein
MMVGLERHVAARPHVMQHEDGADAGEQRTQQMMRPGQGQRAEARADDGIAKLLHQKSGRSMAMHGEG